jgi:Cu-Zn family superoxide dismutase
MPIDNPKEKTMNRLPRTKLLSAAILAALLSACATTPKPMATAQLEGRSGSSVSGTVSFFPAGEGTRIEADVRGLASGEHGFHVHEVGDCSAPDATSAKGHFNPSNKTHGHYAQGEHHAGDMPNLVADSNGKAHYEVEVPNMYLATGPVGIIGRSVVIHADPDDYKSQPAGNSGKRVACGVIRRS